MTIRSVALLTLTLAACATTRSRATTTDDVVVHTLRRHFNNVHVLVQGPNAVLIDGGLEADAPALAADLSRIGIDPAKLRAVIVTHGHADHAGGAGWFQRHYGTTLVVGAADVEMVGRGTNDRLCPTDATARRQLPRHQGAHFTPLRVDVPVSEPTPLQSIAGIDGTIVPMPGHTPGSLVVTLGDVALVGDVFRGAIVGRAATTHFYMCDLEDNRRDIQALLDDVAPSAARFFTGHFGPIRRGAVERLARRR